MGNVRTDHIKRVARELIRRYPNKFSGNFDENKRLVSQLVQGATLKVRNQIAGYITRIYSGVQPQEEVSAEESG
ncbi:MAG: 30S ribosomal protein S17e [Candidatus Bathyarchaeota archaeon]|nr:30S ribosomal protein S17e [Candidatus Bathyarchaeota archaeon]MCX8177335.1 30S ribosomal protein S17e [Candidatus Bathyarchaeota archaeon]MDW8193781.1 30S ribosomal protein S17e [Nitrososphaerota archaeon]